MVGFVVGNETRLSLVATRNFLLALLLEQFLVGISENASGAC